MRLPALTGWMPNCWYHAPSGGDFTVDLRAYAGTFAVEWMNPATGTNGANASRGAMKPFTPPFSGDAMLYLNVNVSRDPQRN
jgi:hypothetical protein